MAAIGRTARAQIVQIVKNRMRVAGFRTSAQAGLDRSQSASVQNVMPAAMAWEDFDVTRPAWCRDMSPGYLRGFATKDSSGKTSVSSGDTEEEARVDSQVREELGEPEGGPAPGVKDKAKQAVSKVGEKVKDAGEAMKSSTDSKTADKVGDTVKGAGDSIEDKGAKQQRLGKEDVVTS